MSNVKIVNIYSKKDDDLRTKELASVVSDRFLQHIKEAPEFWLSNGSIAMVLLGIFKCGSGNINNLRYYICYTSDMKLISS